MIINSLDKQLKHSNILGIQTEDAHTYSRHSEYFKL